MDRKITFTLVNSLVKLLLKILIDIVVKNLLNRVNNMDIPNHLSHKPIVKLEDYTQLDGKFANESDAEGLSIGLAQWSNAEEMDLSAKVWRYTGEKWSRQSEELPIHRVLDLASLLCASISYAKNETLPIYDDFHITLSKNPALIEVLKEGVANDNEYLDKSLKRLSRYLKALGY